MEQDKEMLDIFTQEILEIHKELSKEVNMLLSGNEKNMNKDGFKNFGQMIDRIYGTATTMGFSEIGAYCGALKGVCYMAAQSDNIKGVKKTLRMMIECIGFLEKLTEAIYDPKKIKLFNKNIMIETGKADRLNRSEFASIETKSCA